MRPKIGSKARKPTRILRIPFRECHFVERQSIPIPLLIIRVGFIALSPPQIWQGKTLHSKSGSIKRPRLATLVGSYLSICAGSLKTWRAFLNVHQTSVEFRQPLTVSGYLASCWFDSSFEIRPSLIWPNIHFAIGPGQFLIRRSFAFSSNDLFAKPWSINSGLTIETKKQQ
jgi:hypothetical protein